MNPAKDMGVYEKDMKSIYLLVCGMRRETHLPGVILLHCYHCDSINSHCHASPGRRPTLTVSVARCVTLSVAGTGSGQGTGGGRVRSSHHLSAQP
ncbi:hypothetical protein RRG08_048985 [Elysia crispata]|uniref:Uncharacterized protein n=1 Tax=Elysia crispata TaxID=231223 RepID=A0AAE0YCV2_9GAST|nr:hypothetical protein RRG08_048985 [Elysia crispata]